MRIYEYSRQCGVPSNKLLKLLKKGGFVVSSHMSVLTPEALTFLRKQEKPVNKSKQESKNPSQSGTSSNMKSVSNVSKKRPPNHRVSTQRKFRNTRSVAREVEKPSLPLGPVLIESSMLSVASERMGKPVNELIITLLKWGVLANKNQMIPAELILRLAEEFGLETEMPVVVEQIPFASAEGVADRKGAKIASRAPVTVILGHVDHGKTTLLDYIRKSRVAAGEKGGITQHLGAYNVPTSHGDLVFLDTPGHEAFSMIRARGTHVADIAILIIAADDGIMPQTIESIRHAKEANVPIVVAINKIDKVDSAKIEVVKRQLSQHNLLPEEWGGDTVCIGISAKDGTGVDELLDMVALQSEMLELKADIHGPASGYVLESKMERGRGVVATIICHDGELKIGDFFLCGKTRGRVTSMVNSAGKQIKRVGPSIPVLVAGFKALPSAGDRLQVVEKSDYRKAMPVQSESMVPTHFIGQGATSNLIIKSDTHSSIEALEAAINKLSDKTKKKYERAFTILHSGVGEITERDIVLAKNANALIFALHVKPNPNALAAAQQSRVKIESFDIIYKLLERIEDIAQSAQIIKMVRKKTGEAVVRRVFNVKGLGVIAGCYVKDGTISKEGFIVAYRGKQKIGEGKITSLQREKKHVKEVHAGFECGFIVEGLEDWAPEDRAECFIEVPEAKSK